MRIPHQRLPSNQSAFWHIYEAVERVDGAPDPCMENHYAYGLKEGWPRIRGVLREFGVKATLNSCGLAVSRMPEIARQAFEDGHEISDHGWRWERHDGMEEEHEREVIARTAATGVAPVGWHPRSSTSANTRWLLIEHGGFMYDSNAYDADVPYVERRDHVALPYPRRWDERPEHTRKR